MSYLTDISNVTPATNTTPYIGLYYAFIATGGYTIGQGFDTIRLAKQIEVLQYDLTQALQVRYDVRIFNQKLGLCKDASNQYIIDSSFNPITDLYPIDSITISASEFVNFMNPGQVISVGTYSTLYRDFQNYINTYFGYAGGFESLFNLASSYVINGGVFDASAFLNIITGPTMDGSGAYVNALNGTITISNINTTLRYAIDSNVFGNRDPINGTTASDPSNNADYGMADGFLAGDLFYIPTGTNITLTLLIEPELYTPINNIGPTNVGNLTASSNHTSNSNLTNSTNYTQNTIPTTTSIIRTLEAPLLIRLDNISTAYIPNNLL